MRADQVPEEASSLQSDDVFLLETPEKNYLWYGEVSRWFFFASCGEKIFYLTVVDSPSSANSCASLRDLRRL